MAKLEIDYIAETDTSWAFLRFRQEGLKGFVLPMSHLAELLSALENKEDSYFWMNYGIHHKGSTITLSISTSERPLLQIDKGQCAKLVAHLKREYASELK